MLTAIINQFNWVDVSVVLVFLRICYTAVKKGLAVELFKLPGVLLAIYLGAHYYASVSDLAAARFLLNKEKMPLEFLDFISFLALAGTGILIFFLARMAFCRLIKMEAVPYLNKWGGFIIGVCRGVLFSGLIVFILAASSIDYLKNSAYNSYSGKWLAKNMVNTYTWLWENAAGKFITSEKFNKTVLEIQEAFDKK